MTKGRDDVAEQMNDLFSFIRTRRQSGLLSVERYESGRFEEGEIHFQKGQPVDARIGNRVGQDALSWLATWRQVYFLFSPESSLSDRSPRAPNTSSSLPPTSPTTSTTGPLSPRLPTPKANIPQLPSPTPQPISHTSYYEHVPCKLMSEQNVMNLSLTRPQRSLYLLVDGRRTTADLIRFTSRDVQEVRRLLLELQARGLITM